MQINKISCIPHGSGIGGKVNGETYEQTIPHDVWSKAGQLQEPTIHPEDAPLAVSVIFGSFLVIVGLFITIWFWKIG